MIMITKKAEDDIIQSMTSGFTLWSFGTTPPSSLFGFFGHSMYDVIVASTVNQSRSASLCSNHFTDAFNVIWN